MFLRASLKAGVPGLALAICLTGCPTRNPQPHTLASLQADIAATPRLTAVAAETMVRVVEPGQEPLTATFRFWLDGKNRLRLRATKTDITFLDLLVDTDGHVLAVDPRAPAITRFRMNDPRLPALLRFLPRLTDELRCGPLAAGQPTITLVTPGHAEGHLADGTPAIYDLDPNDDPAVIILDQLTIHYDRWQDFTGVRRPSRLRLTVEGTELMAVLRSFDALGTISAERMVLTPPAGAPELSLDRFLDQLGR